MKDLKKKVMLCTLAGAFAIGGSAVALPDFNAVPAGLFFMQRAEAAEGGLHWEDGKVVAVGYGVPPTGVYGARANLLARRAAVVDAQRNLAEFIQGTQIDAETTLYNYMTENDTVKTRVSALIQGATIVEEEAMSDGSYRVTMSVSLYGAGKSVSSAILPALRENKEPLPPPVVVSPAPATRQEIQDRVKNGTNYTGVIVDAGGMGLMASFSPVIYDTNGRAVYGIQNIDYDRAISQGMVGYAKNVASAMHLSRVGSTPLVVKAVQVRGGRNSVNPVNVVVSVEDANRILLANEKSNMLQGGSVVFVR